LFCFFSIDRSKRQTGQEEQGIGERVGETGRDGEGEETPPPPAMFG